jgi:hypothetical protein
MKLSKLSEHPLRKRKKIIQKSVQVWMRHSFCLSEKCIGTKQDVWRRTGKPPTKAKSPIGVNAGLEISRISVEYRLQGRCHREASRLVPPWPWPASSQ